MAKTNLTLKESRGKILPTKNAEHEKLAWNLREVHDTPTSRKLPTNFSKTRGQEPLENQTTNCRMTGSLC